MKREDLYDWFILWAVVMLVALLYIITRFVI